MPTPALADEVRDLLHPCAPVVTAYCERSYQFAAAFAAADGAQLDEGAVPRHSAARCRALSRRSRGERFEVRGAKLVRALLLDQGIECDREANVGDCSAMHASTPLARHKSLKARYCNLGIALDVRGSGNDLGLAMVRAVLDRWPRHDFPAGFEMVLADQLRAHPDSLRMSWLESVESAHVPGFVSADFLADLSASARFA